MPRRLTITCEHCPATEQQTIRGVAHTPKGWTAYNGIDRCAACSKERKLEPLKPRATPARRRLRAPFEAMIPRWIDPAIAPPETSLGDFDLSVRTANCLLNLGLRTVGDLAAHTDAELLKTLAIGPKSIRELAELGLRPVPVLVINGDSA